MDEAQPALWPPPRSLELGGGELTLPPGGEPIVAAQLDAQATAGPQGYELRISARGVRLVASDRAGLFYGRQTLAQLLRTGPRLPCCVIRDRPVFLQRGVMLDVSRDRVPRLESLFELVERLASWKVNQLQLYTEHTFAYRGHEAVWRGWDPFTPEEIRALDDFCAERFVELVPNQQSFGHMHRWLVHERYRGLAECPEGVEHPFSRAKEPFSLCPLDPGALALLADLYDELLPCFRSPLINVGLDETFDLGLGRSQQAGAERGVGRVYLDFLLAVNRLVRERGHRMQFWADILLHHPELVRELPRDALPCLWGYEADHPFEQETRTLAESGLEFLVCPGTSSWQSIAGRFANMSANVLRAVRHARASGAAGILITDWGDRGHLQPLPASYPGWLLAAGLSWNPDAAAEAATPARMAELLARHALLDPTENAARALVRLAQAGEATGARARNASPLFLVLSQFDRPFPPDSIQGLSKAGLERALGEIDAALALLAGQRMQRPDAALVEEELTWAAGLLRFCALLGLQRLRRGPGTSLSDLALDVRVPLAAELESLTEQHRVLWLRRSRRGGLEHSCAWLERPLAALRDGADGPG